MLAGHVDGPAATCWPATAGWSGRVVRAVDGGLVYGGRPRQDGGSRRDCGARSAGALPTSRGAWMPRLNVRGLALPGDAPQAKAIMAKEKNATTAPFMREFFQLGIYKRSQGRVARQVTFAVLAIVIALGAWRLSVFEADAGVVGRLYVPTILGAVGVWLAFRLVNLPAFADFLIAVEAEMNKVSWPTRTELVRSSLVVIFCIFFLAAILYAYDLFWSSLLHLLRVVGVDK